MSKHIAYLSIGAALLAGALGAGTAAAADLYGYGEGGPPLAFRSRDDVLIDGDRARLRHIQEIRPAGYGAPRDLGPVVFDESGPGRRYGDGGGDDGRPPYGYGRPASFAPPPPPPPAAAFGYGEGPAYRPGPFYRPVGVAGPDDGAGYRGPDVGCTTEQARSVTPAGWRKIVTYRTCYRR